METALEIVDNGLMSEKDSGVSGGEVNSSTWYRIWEGPDSWAIGDGFAFELLEGIEKLRGAVNEVDGSLDATFVIMTYVD